VAVSIGMFYLTHDNPKGAIVAGANWGRDTDCQGAMAAGLSGALTGKGNIPQEWIDTVEAATSVSKVTLYRRTMDEEAKGIYDAINNNVTLMRRQIASLDL
jgi:ADP-ribosylglycohydrolase